MIYLLALVDCYKSIPKPFFEEKFLFDSKKLSRQVKKMNEVQNEVFEFLQYKFKYFFIFSFLIIWMKLS